MNISRSWRKHKSEPSSVRHPKHLLHHRCEHANGQSTWFTLNAVGGTVSRVVERVGVGRWVNVGMMTQNTRTHRGLLVVAAIFQDIRDMKMCVGCSLKTNMGNFLRKAHEASFCIKKPTLLPHPNSQCRIRGIWPQIPRQVESWWNPKGWAWMSCLRGSKAWHCSWHKGLSKMCCIHLWYGRVDCFSPTTR